MLECLTNLELLKENLDKVNDAERYGGSMEAEYASRKATTANNITLLKNSVRALAQRIGETLLPTVSELATKASALLGKLAQWAKNNPKVASTLAKIAIAGGVLLTVLGAGIAIFGAAGMALGHIMTMLAPVTGALAGAGVAAGGIAAPLLLIAGVGLLIWKYWDSVKGVFTGLWDGLVAGIQPAIPALEMIRDTLQRILAPTEANADAWAIFAAIGYAVGHVLGTVVTVAVVGLAIAIETLANAFQWVGQFIGNTIGFIVTGLGHLWDVITGIFNGDWGQVMAALQGHWNNINQYFGGLPAKFAEFGINMVQGLVRGITSMLGAPGEALAKVADGTISRLKNLLGIESPSRVFAQLGGFTMAGFTQGLLGGQNGAQNALARIGNGLRTTAAGIAIGTVGVATAGNTVPLDTRPPLAGARGAMATGGGATYNITINATGNTQAQDIARMVRDEIERLERNRAVRNRSELSDYE